MAASSEDQPAADRRRWAAVLARGVEVREHAGGEARMQVLWTDAEERLCIGDARSAEPARALPLADVSITTRTPHANAGSVQAVACVLTVVSEELAFTIELPTPFVRNTLLNYLEGAAAAAAACPQAQASPGKRPGGSPGRGGGGACAAGAVPAGASSSLRGGSSFARRASHPHSLRLHRTLAQRARQLLSRAMAADHPLPTARRCEACGQALATSPAVLSAQDKLQRGVMSVPEFNAVVRADEEFRREQPSDCETCAIVAAFNSDAEGASSKQAVRDAMAAGLAGPLPSDVALWLRTTPGLHKVKVGEFLGSKKQADTLAAFASSFSFLGVRFETGLRFFMGHFGRVGEAQELDRVLQSFADVWFRDNPREFSSADAVMVLAFSCVLLNTDLHQPTLKGVQKMTEQGFVNNNRGIDGGRDIARPLLVSLYHSIAEHAFAPFMPARPLAEERGAVELVFFEGPLGLRLATGYRNTRMVVKRVDKHSQAGHKYAHVLRKGLIVTAVNGESVVGMQYDVIMQAIVYAPRPLTVRFCEPTLHFGGAFGERRRRMSSSG